jgi:hypothetical protein
MGRGMGSENEAGVGVRQGKRSAGGFHFGLRTSGVGEFAGLGFLIM